MLEVTDIIVLHSKVTLAMAGPVAAARMPSSMAQAPTFILIIVFIAISSCGYEIVDFLLTGLVAGEYEIVQQLVGET